MTLLYPSVLWLLVPLALLLWKSTKSVQMLTHSVILMLLVVALARPVQEEVLQESNIEAKDIIIALDVSYSMRATDLLPTRYDFAKETIKKLLAKNPSDNIMLMAFTTNPLLLSPPTTDHALINIALESLNPTFILTKGTSLKRLFTRLSQMHLAHKNLILITDGGEESNLDALVPLLIDSQVSLTVLALGSTQGTTIKTEDGTLLKDAQGNLVLSRINPLLKALAAQTGGNYLTASSSTEATAAALDDVLSQNDIQKQLIQKMQRHYAERYQFVLVLALLLFLMVHTRAVKYLVLLFSLLGLQAQASVLDIYHLKQAYSAYKKEDFGTASKRLKQIAEPSLQSQLALGNSAYKEGAYKKAIAIYRVIHSTAIPVKQQLYYNIATAYAKLEAYDKAKMYYTKTLQLGEDEDALFNLKLIALLSDKKEAGLGIAHPKSQNANASKSQSQESDKEERREDKQSSSGGAGGAEREKQQEKKEEDKENKRLNADNDRKQHPLGSKVYDLINKGYIRETQPW